MTSQRRAPAPSAAQRYRCDALRGAQQLQLLPLCCCEPLLCQSVLQAGVDQRAMRR